MKKSAAAYVVLIYSLVLGILMFVNVFSEGDSFIKDNGLFKYEGSLIIGPLFVLVAIIGIIRVKVKDAGKGIIIAFFVFYCLAQIAVLFFIIFVARLVFFGIFFIILAVVLELLIAVPFAFSIVYFVKSKRENKVIPPEKSLDGFQYFYKNETNEEEKD